MIVISFNCDVALDLSRHRFLFLVNCPSNKQRNVIYQLLLKLLLNLCVLYVRQMDNGQCFWHSPTVDIIQLCRTAWGWFWTHTQAYILDYLFIIDCEIPLNVSRRSGAKFVKYLVWIKSCVMKKTTCDPWCKINCYVLYILWNFNIDKKRHQFLIYGSTSNSLE